MFLGKKRQKRWWEFVLTMTEKEIKARYKKAIFGFLWIFLNPLLQMMVIGYIFQFFVQVKIINYFEFLFPGLLTWNFFSYTITKNTQMYINERNLIQKAKFPREAIVLSIVFSNLFHYLISMVMFLLWVALFGNSVNWWGWIFLPLTILWIVMLTVGFSLLFSSLNVKWRDINFGVNALIPLWFYATPVVYSLDLLPVWMERIVRLNPMSALMEVLRWNIFGSAVDWRFVGVSVVISLLIFLLGVMVFRKESPYFDDWL